MRFLAPMLLLLSVAASAEAQEPAFTLIVHPGSDVSSVDRKFLGDAFLKKATRWPNGDPIQPVDQDGDSVTRRKFTKGVLERTVSAVKSHWQQAIFSGRDLPPPELKSDAEVVGYVLKHPGAVGYVSAGADTGGAKVITVK